MFLKEEVNVNHNPPVQTDSETMLLSTFKTKESPVLGLHFTRRNLLLAIGNQAPLWRAGLISKPCQSGKQLRML